MNTTYFRWLYDKIDRTDNSYLSLMDILFSIPFTYDITMDANREGDIQQLQEQFIWEFPDAADTVPPIFSMFELIINLSRTMEYQSLLDHEVDDIRPFFWDLIDNLGFMDFTDDFMSQYPNTQYVIRQTIHDVLNHNYNPYSGSGSLFPVTEYGRDRTKMELWDQMASYILQES